MSRKVVLELDTDTNNKIVQYQLAYEKLTGKRISKPDATMCVLKGESLPTGFNKVQEIDIMKG
jgi:hypothetical protein